MANRTRIKAMARELNLQTIAIGQLKEFGMGNLDYLEMVLSAELEARKQNAIAKIKKFCNLPTVRFEKEKLNSGLLTHAYGTTITKTCWKGSLIMRKACALCV